MNIVGNYIRVVRERRKMSQGELAKLLKLKTAQSISNIERGVSPFPPAKTKKFAGALQVSPWTIVNFLLQEDKIKLLTRARLLRATSRVSRSRISV